MIRFIPDTWAEWLLRPLTMTAPNGWVYTELVAPDFRFLSAVLLAAVLIAATLRRRRGEMRALWALGALIAVSFIPWLATSGNGRYFMPYLLLVGPLCIGLAWRLPASRAMRLFLVALVMAAQVLAMSQNSPWKRFDGWEWIAWREAPYFKLDTGAATEENVTYVTLATLTFATVAPLFPASSRWVNLSIFSGDENVDDVLIYKRMERILAAGNLRLLHRAQVSATDGPQGLPNAHAVSTLNATLAPHRLAIADVSSCRLLRSASIGQITMVASDFDAATREELVSRAGFWNCPLARTASTPERRTLTAGELRAKQIFERVESLCPRFFAPGQQRVNAVGARYSRNYPGSDSSLILATDDELYIKYERALNPQLIARGGQVLEPGFQIDCNAFTGRAGLPWQRKI